MIVTVLRRARHPLPAIVVAAAVIGTIALHGLRFSAAFTLEKDDRRYTRVAEYVKELPPRSVFISLTHSGSIRYYTGRDVLRWEIIDPTSLDTAVAYLRARGHDVYLVADGSEVVDFKLRFANTRAARELEGALSVDLDGPVIYALSGSAPLSRNRLTSMR